MNILSFNEVIFLPPQAYERYRWYLSNNTSRHSGFDIQSQSLHDSTSSPSLTRIPLRQHTAILESQFRQVIISITPPRITDPPCFASFKIDSAFIPTHYGNPSRSQISCDLQLGLEVGFTASRASVNLSRVDVHVITHVLIGEVFAYSSCPLKKCQRDQTIGPVPDPTPSPSHTPRVPPFAPVISFSSPIQKDRMANPC